MLAGPAQSLVLTTHSVYGREYVALGDVMRVFALKAQSGRDRSVTLFSPQARARFVVDSREAELQGVKYWLTGPPAVKGGQMWLPAMDVVKTLDPLLRGGGLTAHWPLRTIVLDPGHGGDDQGSRGRNGLVEKQLTLDLARRLHGLLVAKGYRVLLTRTDDRDVALQSRSAFARGNHADLFMSIHFNSVTSSSEPRGAETYCLTPSGAPSTSNKTTSPIASDFVSFVANRFDADNVVLAHFVQQHLVRGTGAAERGVKRARFEVLKDLVCPGVLVECGFLSNPADLRLISQDAHRQKLAAAIASGIEAYKQTARR